MPSKMGPGAILDPFASAVTRFKRRLTKEELLEFEGTTLAELEAAIYRIQKEQETSKRMVNIRRVQPFLEGMKQLGKVVEVFLNVSTIVAFIWGPMKFLIQTANTMSESLEILLETYERLGEHLPMLQKYARIFDGDSIIQEALGWVYEDILEFHSRAIRLFLDKAWKIAFKSIWKDFDSSFRNILDRLKRHEQFVKDQADLLDKERSKHDSAQLSQHVGLYAADSQILRAHVSQYTEDRAARLATHEQEMKDSRLDLLRENQLWLAPALSEDDHREFFEEGLKTPNSGNWILDKTALQQWLEMNTQQKSLLWINGQPGAGKTVLASRIIDETSSRHIASTAYFYCRYDDPNKRTLLAVLRGLLSQMLGHHPELLPISQEKRRTSRELIISSPETAKVLMDFFCEMVSEQYIIVDGLDECEKEDRGSILSYFKQLTQKCSDKWCEPGKIRVLFVSQYLPDISQELSPALASTITISEKDNGADIETYVSIWAQKIEKKFALQKSDVNQMRASACLKARGMFLFAKLVMPNLLNQSTQKLLLKELQASVFPTGLGQAYKRILTRLKRELTSTNWKISLTLLGWVICAKRPLKWREIQCAISIDPDTRIVDYNMNQLRSHITEFCGPLVMDSSGDTVQLVHSTATDGITSAGCLSTAIVECNLAALCLRYFTFDCFGRDQTVPQVESYALSGYYAFQDYAIAKWMHHFHDMIKACSDLCSGDFNAQFEHYGDQVLDSRVTNYTKELGPRLGKEEADFALLDLDDAMDKFMHRYDDEFQDVPTKEVVEACKPFEKKHYHENVQYILNHIYNHQGRGFQIRAEISISALNKSFNLIRDVLENIAASEQSDDTKGKLYHFHGKAVYKCPKTTCSLFHEGFLDAKARDEHINNHDRPYQCEVPHCTYVEVGFRTNIELTKHNKIFHPDVRDEEDIFIIPEKKIPAKALQPECSICKKRFSRKFILKQHMNSHLGERPFACSECGKTFVRSNDCKRHERTIHNPNRTR